MITNNKTLLSLAIALYTLSSCGGGNSDDGGGATPPVEDTTPPVITLTGSSSLQHEAGLDYTDAGATASDDTDGVLSADIVTAGSVDSNALGSYTLTYNVTDAAGNSAATVSRTVTVVDTTAPTLTLVDAATNTLEVGGTYTESGATAEDSFEGTLTANVVITGAVDTGALGSYTLTYNVSDSSGNQATPVTRTVLVVDTTLPIVTLLGESSVTVELGEAYIDQGATASDNLDGDISADIVTNGMVNSEVIGSYQITYDVSDSSGNQAATVTRDITVEDTTPPTVVSTTPVSDGASVSIGTDIVVVFDEAILSSSINTSSFTVSDVDGNSVDGALSIEGNGTTLTFVPDTQLAMNTLYIVTLSTGVSDLYGNTLANSYSWEFTTEGENTAGLPELINIPANPVFNPAMDTNSTGKTAAIWGQNGVININRYTPADGWLGVEQVSPEGTSPHMVDYRVAMSDNGNIVVAWVSTDLTTFDDNLSVRVYSEANGWSTTTNLNVNAGHNDQPEVSMDNDGNAAVVWRYAENNGLEHEIYAAHYNHNNASWDVPIALTANIEGSFDEPNISMNSTGQAMAVWVKDGSMLSSTFFDFDSLTSSFVWSIPVSIGLDEVASMGAFHPNIAINSDGDTVVAWGQQTASNSSGDIYANHYSTSTGWSGAAALETMIEGEARSPQVAINSTHAIVIWAEYDGAAYSMYSNTLNSLGQWDGASLLEDSPYNAGSSSGGTQGGAHVYLSQSGTVTTVWSQNVVIAETMVADSRVNMNRFDITESPDSSQVTVLVEADPSAEILEPVLGGYGDSHAIVVSQKLLGNSLDIQTHIIE